MSVEALCEDLVRLVDDGELHLVHDGVFLHQAQPAAVRGGVEVGQEAILEVPDMGSQTYHYCLQKKTA